MEGERRSVRAWLERVDDRVVGFLERYGHRLHRRSLGLLFVWLGLLKPMGHETATSLLAHIIHWGSPETTVVVLGWWEVAIGLAMSTGRSSASRCSCCSSGFRGRYSRSSSSRT